MKYRYPILLFVFVMVMSACNNSDSTTQDPSSSDSIQNTSVTEPDGSNNTNTQSILDQQDYSNEDSVVVAALEAIKADDWLTREKLRPRMTEKDAGSLAAYWDINLSREEKDGFINMLWSFPLKSTKDIMKDGFNSPNPEIRAYSLCSITEDYQQFINWLNDRGNLDPKKVDAAIEAYLSSGNQ